MNRKPRRTAHCARILCVLVLGAGLLVPVSGWSQDIANAYRDDANRLIDAALANHDAYTRLAELVDLFGHRVSGSVALENAIDWIIEQMESDGLDNARGDMVMVPHWVRGEESLQMTLPRPRALPMLGLGGSIATPPGGIRAEVLVVSSFDELERRADEAQGKIVLFDVPFTNYGETVQYRSQGAIAAARAGAAASIIRSVTPYSQQTPHTGNMNYADAGLP